MASHFEVVVRCDIHNCDAPIYAIAQPAGWRCCRPCYVSLKLSAEDASTHSASCYEFGWWQRHVGEGWQVVS